MNYLFTSESVSEGHPDKVSDQISDAILDEFLRQDPESKVACETFCSTGLVVVGGEVRSDDAYVDIPKTVRRVSLSEIEEKPPTEDTEIILLDEDEDFFIGEETEEKKDAFTKSFILSNHTLTFVCSLIVVSIYNPYFLFFIYIQRKRGSASFVSTSSYNLFTG